MFTTRNAWILFFITRLIIIFGYGAYLTDVHFYHGIATAAIKNGQTAYTDFLWGYPPLSLITVYLPIIFGFETLESYRTLYQIFNFAFEILTFATLIKIFSSVLKIPQVAATKALFIYSILGLFVGHIIYDRVDFFIVLCFTAALLLSRRSTLDQTHIMASLGTAWKVIPALWWPVYFLLHAKVKLKSAMKFALICGAVLLLFLGAWNAHTDGAMVKHLNLHSERGIQIESTWATPLMLLKVFDPSVDITVENNHGGQHLGGSALPQWALTVSKIFGHLILLVIFGLLARHLYQLKKLPDDIEFFHLAFLFSSLVIVSFIATQRVFSTTFIVWLLPIAAIDLAVRFSKLRTALYFGIFILTYMGFALGYFRYAAFEPQFVYTYTVRNILVVALFADFARQTGSHLSAKSI